MDKFLMTRPFCYSKSNIKAIVLGSDPSNKSNYGTTVKLHTVFGIGTGDARYFSPILKNLECVGLDIFSIYVQNLIQEYLEFDTDKHPEWEKYAITWLPRTKIELDEIDPTGKIPVFVTGLRLLKFLWKNHSFEPEDIYKGEIQIPIKESNKLERPLIPLFRHPKYNLSSGTWKLYQKRVSELF